MSYTPTNRDELYELVWSRPLAQVAVYLDTTLALLRKVCIDNQIPVPQSDYWRLKGKQERTPTPLPPADSVAGFNLNDALGSAQNSLLYPGETALSFAVSTKLHDPDPLIISAKESLYDDTFVNSLTKMKRAGWEQLPIYASATNIDRALRIMDTLVKSWRKRGYQIRVQFKHTDVLIREVWQRISLRELSKKLDEVDANGFTKYDATGILALKVDAWPDREWKDGKLPLEKQLLDVLNHMELGARELEAIWAAAAEQRKQNEIKEQQRKQDIKSDPAELDAFESLVQEASRWQQLRALHDYLEEMYKVAPHTPTFLNWYRSMRDRVKLFNPLADRIKTIEESEN